MTRRRRQVLGGLGAGVLAVAAPAGAVSAGPGSRTGLPWPSGVPGWRPDGLATWRGRPLDLLTVFSRFDSRGAMRTGIQTRAKPMRGATGRADGTLVATYDW